MAREALSWLNLLFGVSADVERFYAKVDFLELIVQRLEGCRARLGQLEGFGLATLVDIRSSKAPHCLIRRSNR